MNITYIIGVVLSFVFILLGMMGFPAIDPGKIMNFVDGPSAMIVIGCTVAILAASLPVSTLKSIGSHMKIVMNTKLFDPMTYIDQLTELANKARKDGLLSLEASAAETTDPFMKSAIMLLVDGSDADRVRAVLETDTRYGLKRLVAALAASFQKRSSSRRSSSVVKICSYKDPSAAAFTPE